MPQQKNLVYVFWHYKSSLVFLFRCSLARWREGDDPVKCQPVEVRALKGFLQQHDQAGAMIAKAVAITDKVEAHKDYTLQLGIRYAVHCTCPFIPQMQTEK